MKAMKIDFKELFIGNDMRSPNGANEACEICINEPKRICELIEIIKNGTKKQKMCASDALEKISSKNPCLLNEYIQEIIEIAKADSQKEVRWHIAQISPRLDLSENQAKILIEIMQTYFNDKSRIVITYAMNAIWEISQKHKLDESSKIIIKMAENGPPSVKARARILLSNTKHYKK